MPTWLSIVFVTQVSALTFLYSSITKNMQRYTMVFITINALHVSGCSSAHHQELKNFTHSIGYMSDFCSNSPTLAVRSTKSLTYTRCCVYSFWAPDDWAEEPPETFRAFIVTNTIVKLCILLVMLEYINDARSHERKTDVFLCVNLSHFTELHFVYRQKIIPLLLGTYCKNFIHIRSNDTRFRLLSTSGRVWRMWHEQNWSGIKTTCS
jgi:hypothetical protein